MASAGHTCDLCEAARLTAWHYEDDVCFVADCESCGVPMVVWRRHGAEPPEEVRRHLLGVLERVASEILGASGFRIDTVMRQIPDHFHAHARVPGLWWRRAGLLPGGGGGPGR
jgi:Zn ribbon nucleic-acid-binding protein